MAAHCVKNQMLSTVQPSTTVGRDMNRNAHLYGVVEGRDATARRLRPSSCRQQLSKDDAVG